VRPNDEGLSLRPLGDDARQVEGGALAQEDLFGSQYAGGGICGETMEGFQLNKDDNILRKEERSFGAYRFDLPPAFAAHVRYDGSGRILSSPFGAHESRRRSPEKSDFHLDLGPRKGRRREEIVIDAKRALSNQNDYLASPGKDKEKGLTPFGQGQFSWKVALKAFPAN